MAGPVVVFVSASQYEVAAAIICMEDFVNVVKASLISLTAACVGWH